MYRQFNFAIHLLKKNQKANLQSTRNCSELRASQKIQHFWTRHYKHLNDFPFFHNTPLDKTLLKSPLMVPQC